MTGSIVIPGFVDTHRHTWEAAIRGCAPNATLDDYFVEVLDTFAPVYTPEDVYASNLAGSLECLNAGITTLVDWSHINNTPEHPDAAIRALQETGIRAQYAYGSANTSLADYWFESKIAIPGDDVRRVRETYFSSDDGLLTMAPRHPRHRLLHRRRRAVGVGSSPASWASRSPCTWRWAGSPAGSRMVKALNRPRPARPRHHVHPLLLLQRRGVAAGRRHRRHDLDRAAGRDADGPRLAAGGQGDGVRPAPEPVASTSSPPCPATCSPRSAARSAPTGAATTRSGGSATSRPRAT